MSDHIITCPQCGTQIPLTEALTGQIEQNIRLKYEAAIATKDNQVKAKLDEVNLSRRVPG